MDRSFYVYTHSNALGVFYVGKGRGRRAHNFCGRPEAWRESLKGLTKPVVEIISDGLSDSEAKAVEAREISSRPGVINVRCQDNKQDVTSAPKARLGTAIDRNLAEQLEEFVKNNPPWRKVDVIEKALRDFLRENDNA